MAEIITIFTGKPLEALLELGGTGWWKLNAARARKASHVLVCHNADDPRWPGEQQRHGKAFLLATIRAVLQDYSDPEGRWLVQFDEFVPVTGFDWPGFRNPVLYLDADETLGQIEIDGEWQKMPDVSLEAAMAVRAREPDRQRQLEAGRTSVSFGEIIERYRAGLAEDLGVAPEQITITVSG